MDNILLKNFNKDVADHLVEKGLKIKRFTANMTLVLDNDDVDAFHWLIKRPEISKGNNEKISEKDVQAS